MANWRRYGQPYLGSMTFAQMKALTGMGDGAEVFCTSYPPNKGSLWRYSSTLTDWFPIAPCVVYEKTDVTDGVAQAADQLLLAIPAEAGLLANKTFRLRGSLGKNGTTDASGVTSIRLGTAGTTADASVLAASAALTAAARSVGFDGWMRMASATSVVKLGGNPFSPFVSSLPSSTLLNAAATVPSVAANASYVSITTAMGGTTDKPQVGYVALEIQP